jgi:hypothetical protein
LSAVNGAISDTQKNEIKILISNSVNAAKIATDINPQSATDWVARGYIYKSFSGLINNSDKWSTDCYKKAIELDPNNPTYPQKQ